MSSNKNEGIDCLIYSSIHFFCVKETRLKHFRVALHDTSPKMNRENNAALIFQKVDSHAPETDSFPMDFFFYIGFGMWNNVGFFIWVEETSYCINPLKRGHCDH